MSAACTRDALCAAMTADINAPIAGAGTFVRVMRPSHALSWVIGIAVRGGPGSRSRLLDACPHCAADVRWWGSDPPRGFATTFTPPLARVGT